MTDTPIGLVPGILSVIIPRNSVVPISRSEMYVTASDQQEKVQIEVFQGENPIAKENVPLGSFMIEGLPPKPAGQVEIEVHFDFDINGILTVTSTEKGLGQEGSLVVNNTGTQRMSSQELRQAQLDLESLFAGDDAFDVEVEATGSVAEAVTLTTLIEQAQQVLEALEPEQAEEIKDLLRQVEAAQAAEDTETLTQLQEELGDALYYASTQEEA